MLPPWNCVVAAGPAVDRSALDPPIARIEQIRERRLERVRDLPAVRPRGEPCTHEGDMGADFIPGSGSIEGQPPDGLDEIRIQSDFFLRLAQRRGKGIPVLPFDPPPGKTDLAGVQPKILGAADQMDEQPGLPLNDRAEHGRRGELAAGLRISNADGVAGRTRTLLPEGALDIGAYHGRTCSASTAEDGASENQTPDERNPN